MMNKLFRDVAILLIGAAFLAATFYASYHELLLAVSILSLFLATVLLLNRYAQPRWQLNQEQTRTEKAIRWPTALVICLLVFLILEGEKGLQNLSNTLTLVAFFGGGLLLLLNGKSARR